MDVIFLISLPRSGSTLLQHLLGSHSLIAASAEPWVLLPHLLALKKNAFYSKYQPEIGRVALTDFLSQTEGKEQVYYDGVREYSNHLYSKFLEGSGKDFFLDKTSRYYLALPELYRVYPDAKYIFLFRNPLSVLSSFIENMVQGNLKALASDGIREDLLDGYRIMFDQLSNKNIDSCTITYESLIENPENEMQKLCQFIGIDFEPGMLNYGGKDKILHGKLVDPKSIHKHSSPVNDYLHTWKKILDSTERKEFAKGYLNFLGKDVVEAAGYDFDLLIKRCSGRRPLSKSKGLFRDIMLSSNSKRAYDLAGALRSLKKGNIKVAFYKLLKPILV